MWVEILEKNSAVYFKVKDEDSLLALCTLNYEGSGLFTINDLVNYQDDYDALELLFTEIEQYCYEKNAGGLAVRLIEKKESLVSLIKPLGLAGFTPINTGTLLEYELSDLINTEFVKRIKDENPKKLFKSVLPYEELDKAQKNSFYIKRKASFSYNSGRNWDDKFSAFYIFKGNVIGALIADCTESKPIALEEIFAEATSDAKYVLPVLLGKFLYDISKKYDKKTRIQFVIYEDGISGWISDVLGKAFINKDIFEYAKLL